MSNRDFKNLELENLESDTDDFTKRSIAYIQQFDENVVPPNLTVCKNYEVPILYFFYLLEGNINRHSNRIHTQRPLYPLVHKHKAVLDLRLDIGV